MREVLTVDIPTAWKIHWYLRLNGLNICTWQIPYMLQHRLDSMIDSERFLVRD